jgi:hypothetical protein
MSLVHYAASHPKFRSTRHTHIHTQIKHTYMSSELPRTRLRVGYAAARWDGVALFVSGVLTLQVPLLVPTHVNVCYEIATHPQSIKQAYLYHRTLERPRLAFLTHALFIKVLFLRARACTPRRLAFRTGGLTMLACVRVHVNACGHVNIDTLTWPQDEEKLEINVYVYEHINQRVEAFFSPHVRRYATTLSRLSARKLARACCSTCLLRMRERTEEASECVCAGGGACRPCHACQNIRVTPCFLHFECTKDSIQCRYSRTMRIQCHYSRTMRIQCRYSRALYTLVQLHATTNKCL